jgi:hypothetical protein
VGVLVLLQLAINRAKPLIDRIIYRQDQEELAWIDTLDRRLLTTADLSAFLENSLAAMCDLLQVRTAFVAVLAGGQHHLESHCGDKALIQRFLEGHDLATLAMSIATQNGGHTLPASDVAATPGEVGALAFSRAFGAATAGLSPGGLFVQGDEFWLVPLYGQTSNVCLGVLGVQARAPLPDLGADEKRVAALLVARAEEALEDRYLQQNVFDTLRRILPNIERLHRWQDATRYAGTPPMQIIEGSPVDSPEFQQWVKDALSHYWGGPKLTESPLLGLGIVGDRLQEQGGNPAQALRVVLNEAIERLRPAGERQMTRSEWILYNILELKFIRGLKVRDIAARLAMSESDLYRKQRVAIAEVARVLADLEQDGVALNGEEQRVKRNGRG